MRYGRAGAPKRDHLPWWTSTALEMLVPADSHQKHSHSGMELAGLEGRLCVFCRGWGQTLDCLHYWSLVLPYTDYGYAVFSLLK